MDDGGSAGVVEATSHHIGEPRWAMAIAVIAAGALHATLPDNVRSLGAPWIYPTVVVGLLLVLVVGDPGRIDKRDPWLRVVNSILIAFITLVNAQSAVHLVRLIVINARLGTADRLLGSGAAIWTINVIAFGLWYWDLDQGGPAERANRTTRLPAFLFPEMTSPEFVRADWYPELIDYLHVSFATATSFGPSDVSAIKHWSKLLMLLESAVSLLLAVLVVARAINLLPG
ncbi:MAG TPA: hypothetical protein VMH41_10735 [Mycobacteriales bacterium]|nr:hypothetical protein [Mycobacteriales bacterium]